jgi:hypothetical protein
MKQSASFFVCLAPVEPQLPDCEWFGMNSGMAGFRVAPRFRWTIYPPSTGSGRVLRFRRADPFKNVQRKSKKMLTLVTRFATVRPHTEHTNTKHMRTKTLLLTAALTVAAAATSMAQAVYSVNIVGYVNKVINPGYTLIAQPFKDGAGIDTTVNTVLASVPDGTTIYTFAGGGFSSNVKDEFGGGWGNPNQTLDLGSGFFINNVSGAPFTVTFVGEVATGTLNNPLPAGYSLRSSKVPQGGTVAALGVVAGLGDSIYRFANGGFVSYVNDEFGGGWGSSQPVDPVNGPTIDVAEAFFYNNVAGTATFTRTFNP